MNQLIAVCVALSLFVGSVPAATMAVTAADGSIESNQPQVSGQVDGNASVRASTGQQLATILEVTDDEVTQKIEESLLESAFESAGETEQAELLAGRAASLRERSTAVAAAYSNATAAYSSGELSDAQYAQRVAVLSGRASSLSTAFDRVDRRAEDVSTLELQAAGYNRTANADARSELRSITGASANALLQQYTGLSNGEFSIDLDNGVSIEVENEDGERTRGFEREQPGDGSFVVAQDAALETAREALSSDSEGEWTLRAVERESNGYYEFEFEFIGQNETGEAEVSVDGETGEIFELDEELEPRDDDDGEEETPLSISIISGEPTPGATVTLRVTTTGEPVANAVVEVDDDTIGTTDERGEIEVILPADEEVEIEVEAGDRNGDLELTIGSEDSDEREIAELGERIAVDGTVADGEATVEISYEGSGVSEAAVYVDDRRIGTTDADGSVTFETAATDELPLRFVKGQLEGDLEISVGQDGSLSLTDADVDRLEADELEEIESEEDEQDEESEDAESEDTEDEDTEDEDTEDAESEDTEDEETEDAESEDTEDEETEDAESEDTEDEEEDPEDTESETETVSDTETTVSGDLSVSLSAGEAVSGGTVTVAVTQDGEPIEGATVTVSDQAVGTTDSNGELSVTLPTDDEARIEAEIDDADGELRFELETNDTSQDDD